MAEKKFSKEIIGALQNCKDAKAVMALAKEKGIELSEEQAGKLFAALQNDNQLSDEDLNVVTGGGCSCFYVCHGHNGCSSVIC